MTPPTAPLTPEAVATQARRLRVLVVSLGRRGGVTRYGQLMAKGLAGQADIAVVSSAAAENRDGWRALDAPHLEVETFSSLLGMFASYLAVARFSAIRRFAREFSPDVVYYPGGHGWKPVLDLILPRSATTVLTVHDPELHVGENTLAHRLFAAANRLRVDGFVLLNAAQRDAFIARHGLDPQAVAVIPHGMLDDLAHARRPLSEVEGLEQVAPFDGRYLLFVGRIERYKGLSTLLAAYERLEGDAADTPLVIAGSGELSTEERTALERLNGRPVMLVNRWLDDTEIASLTASARFVVLPYESASQSGVIPLASSFGVPAIASDAGGIAEQVRNGDTGLLFSAGNSDELTVTLAQALAQTEERYRTMRDRALEFALDEWSWGGLAERLLGFFRELPHNRSR